MENEKTTRKQLFEINVNLILPGIPSTSSPSISLPFSKGKALGTSIPIYPELTPLQHSRKNKLVYQSLFGSALGGGGKEKKIGERSETRGCRRSLRSPIFFLCGPVLPFCPVFAVYLFTRTGLKSSQPANADLFPAVASLLGWTEKATTGNTSLFAG